MTLIFPEHEQLKIREAIEKAESKTSAEIFAVIAERSDEYDHVGSNFLTLWIFIMSLLLALWTRWQGYHIDLAVFIAAQFFAWLCGYFLIRAFPVLGVNMTPRKIRHRRAHHNAVKQFMAHGIHKTTGRTGVLIFVSLQERYAEILVDSAIEAVIPREYWLQSVATLIEHCRGERIAEGYCEVVSKIAPELAKYFSVGTENFNELEDKLVII